MSLKRYPAIAHLEAIIERDYGPVIHDLVTTKFKKFLKNLKKIRRAQLSMPYLKQNSLITCINTHSDYSSGSDSGRNQSESSEGSSDLIDIGKFSESEESSNTDGYVNRSFSLSPIRTDVSKTVIADIHHSAEKLNETSLDIWETEPNINNVHSISKPDRSASFDDISDLLSVCSDKSFESPVRYQVKVKPTIEKQEEDYVIYEETINKISQQEKIIETIEKVITVYGRNIGYIGSLPHAAAAKRLLIANLQKEALIVSLAKDIYFPRTENPKYPKGQVIISDLRLDTDHIGQFGVPPCYYIVTIEQGTTILHTDIKHPDIYGTVEFKNVMLMETISYNFSLKVSLYKMAVLPRPKSLKGIKSSIEVPKLKLIGQHEVSMYNIDDTSFSFNNDILYINFRASVETGIKTMRDIITVSKRTDRNLKEEKFVSNIRWGELEGTNLSIFKDLKKGTPSELVEVIDLMKCIQCAMVANSQTMLVIKYEKSHANCIRYLTFNDNQTCKKWLSALNAAILTGNIWKPTS